MDAKYVYDIWDNKIKFICTCGYRKTYKLKDKSKLGERISEFEESHSNNCWGYYAKK